MSTTRPLYFFGLAYAIIGAFLAAYGYAQSTPRPPVVEYRYLPRTLDVERIDRQVLHSLQRALDPRMTHRRDEVDDVDGATPVERYRIPRQQQQQQQQRP